MIFPFIKRMFTRLPSRGFDRRDFRTNEAISRYVNIQKEYNSRLSHFENKLYGLEKALYEEYIELRATANGLINAQDELEFWERDFREITRMMK